MKKDKYEPSAYNCECRSYMLTAGFSSVFSVSSVVK